VKNLPPPLNVVIQSIADWWDALFVLAGLSILWVLAWMTVVLGPPATLGLFSVANELAHGRGAGWEEFIAGARGYLVKSLLWGLMNLAALVLFSVSFIFYGQVRSVWGLSLQMMVLVICLLWLSAQFYTLPFLLEQEQKRILLAVKNGLMTSLASPIYTLVIVVLTVLVSGVSLILVFPLILGVPGLVAVLSNRALLERLETFGIRTPDQTP
jgi:uncharacterized membrane protein YesL